MATMDAPSTRGKLFNPFNLGLGENARSAPGRERQIVHIEGVLGPHVASSHTIAAIYAGLLVHSVFILAIDCEVHRDIERLRPRPDLLCAAVQGDYLLETV